MAVIHHTSCGTRFLADDGFRRSFAGRIGADETELAEAAVTDAIQSVRRDVEKLLASPLVPTRVAVSGHCTTSRPGWSRRSFPSQSEYPDRAPHLDHHDAV